MDVLAVIVRAEEPVTFTNKKGGETTKRVLLLTDQSCVSVEATPAPTPTPALTPSPTLPIPNPNPIPNRTPI